MDNGLNIPVVMFKGQWVKKYYCDYRLTQVDGFNPERVIRVCDGINKTHKNECFRFANRTEINAYEIFKEVFTREKKWNT